MAVADKIRKDLINILSKEVLVPTRKGGSSSQIQDFFKRCLKELACGDNADIAYYMLFARTWKHIGTDILNWHQVRDLANRFENTKCKHLLWLLGFLHDPNQSEFLPLSFSNNSKSQSFYKKAADLGDTISCYLVAYSAINTNISHTKEMIRTINAYLTKGIEAQSRECLLLKARLLLAGQKGIDGDLSDAINYLEAGLACKPDHYLRQHASDEDFKFYLGQIYFEGIGTDVNILKGLKLLREASLFGHSGAAHWYISRDKPLPVPLQKSAPSDGNTPPDLKNVEKNEKPANPMSFFTKPKPKKDAADPLNDLIGLDTVKSQLKKFLSKQKSDDLRDKSKLKSVKTSSHMIFVGNPGTGKTEVAVRLGKLMHEIGILRKGHIVQANREDLVGEYIGQTAIKTKKQIEKADGGILFIDEAYSLYKDSSRDYGHEAIETLIVEMEARRNNMIVIMAGYPNETDQLLRSNPGLESRFPYRIEFPDYKPDELSKIFENFCIKNDYIATKETTERVHKHYKEHLKKHSHKFSNARDVRNLFEKTIQNQASRILEVKNPKKSDLETILPQDLASDVRIENGNIVYL